MAQIYKHINGRWLEVRVIRRNGCWFPGWICPKCRRIHHPYTVMCSCSYTI